jgi:ribosomal protein S18 acetylase RimI-like enzyme
MLPRPSSSSIHPQTIVPTGGLSMRSHDIHVRRLTSSDLADVTRIDATITGKERKDLWTKRFDAYEGIRPPWACLVAEYDGHVAGFVFGWTSGWEFGIPGEVGWIDIIGVDPVFRGKGIGRALVDQFVEEAQERRGIKRIFTLVNPADPEINGFFGSMGFAPGDMRQLQKQIVA